MAPEHFPGAFDAAIAEQRSEIDAIVANSEAPTFDNTFAAMQRAGSMLDRVERMFGVARQSVTNPAYQALEREWQPKLAAAADEILFNQGLFQRIRAVYDALPASALEPEQMRLVTLVYEHFMRHGAQLNAAETSSGCPRSIRSLPRGSPSSARRYSRTRTHRRSSRTAR